MLCLWQWYAYGTVGHAEVCLTCKGGRDLVFHWRVTRELKWAENGIISWLVCQQEKVNNIQCCEKVFAPLLDFLGFLGGFLHIFLYLNVSAHQIKFATTQKYIY